MKLANKLLYVPIVCKQLLLPKKLRQTVYGLWPLICVRKLLPPVVVEEGSTANTATLWLRSVRNLPNDSINVLFPAPGGPDNPANTNYVYLINVVSLCVCHIIIH